MGKQTEQRTHTQKRGRPPLEENERKRPRNLSVSTTAWIGLETQANFLGINSVSDLNEQIGLGKLSIAAQIESNLDTPIYPRLKSFIKPPVAVFWSLLSFVRRTAKQFGLIEQLDENEDLICDVVKRAITIVFFVSYTHPDHYINNPSAFMRWLSYRILLARIPKQLNKEQLEQLLSDEKIEAEIYKIHKALTMMEEARLPFYPALRMKILDGLTLSQIKRLLIIQEKEEEITEEKVRNMVKMGLAQLRQTLDIAEPEKLQDIETQIGSLAQVKEYFKLASLSYLSKGEFREKMENFLLNAESNNQLDFWIDEINFYLGYELFNSRDKYNQQQEKVRQRIDDEIDDYIQEKVELFKRKLAFCVTKEKINRFLEKIASLEAGCQLDFNQLISNRHYSDDGRVTKA